MKINPKFSFALALLILSAIAGLAIYRLRESGKAAWWAEVSLLLRDELNTILISIEQSQTAVRGFALTGRDEFLQPYGDATNAFVKSEKNLYWFAGTTPPEQREALARIESVARQRLDDLETTIRLARSEGIASAQKRIAEGTGDRLQKECRDLISKFRNEHRIVQEARIQSDHDSRFVALIVVLTGSIFSFALVLLSFVSAQRQIRERERAEAAATESKERLQMTLRGIRAGIWYVHFEPPTIFWSPEFRELYGFSADEPATKERWRGCVHPEDLSRVEREMELLLHGEVKEWQTEFRITPAHRPERWILALVRVWGDATGKPERLGGINLDITERKLVELQLADTQRLLREHSEHLEKTVHERTAKLKDTITELESFSYTVSHDLRNPLRAMHGCAEIVLQDYGPVLPAEGHELLERIIQAARRMDSLTLDLLDYSHIARKDIECHAIDVERVLSEVLALNPTWKAPGVELIVDTPLEKMLGYEPLLRHCLANLLDNAVKYVAPGASPRVRIRSERRESSQAPPHPGAYSRLWIEDNGIGIDPRFHEKIFGIFERLLDHPSEGTGVGLAIVAKAVERMGGHCGVDSVPGKGSRFWIELPAALDHAELA